MVNLDPRTNERQRAKEAAIRVIDLVIYAVAAAGGVFALFITPDTVKAALSGFEWLIVGWGVLLIIAGTLGFVGRFTRFWVIEVPGTIAGVFGGAIYVVVLGASGFSKPTAWVALTLVVIATLALFRRYMELQIFTSEPGSRSLADRLVTALQRRTTNTVPHK